MKNLTPPTDKEYVLEKEAFIVSRTDPKGLVKYTNREFMVISGYEESELLGKSHNNIRHPDMPKAVFKLLWDTIKAGKEFNGYVKNMCKNGDYYWVFATIASSIEDNEQVFYSIRKKPKAKAVSAIEPIYKAMKEVEDAQQDKSLDASLNILLDEFEPFGMDYNEYILTL